MVAAAMVAAARRKWRKKRKVQRSDLGFGEETAARSFCFPDLDGEPSDLINGQGLLGQL
jgi:hypothetical protein